MSYGAALVPTSRRQTKWHDWHEWLGSPLKAHTLMQAIARVNRVFRDKPGGLVVDYLGLADELKAALATYTESGGKGETIHHTLAKSSLGNVLVAATDRGICMIELGDDVAALEARLQEEFPRARLQRVDSGRDEFLAPRVHAVAERLAGRAGKVPVDLIGTAFQKKVWEMLI